MLQWLERILGGSRAEASHPGCLRADVGRVARCYPLWPTVLGVAWLIALAAVVDGFHYTAIGLLAVATYANYAWWASIRRWFRRGDVCAAAIISIEPLLIAAMNDLTLGDGSYPAVKVRRESGQVFASEAIKAGQPVACVAMYDGEAGAAHYSNFHPRPAQCATSDPAEIKRLLSEIDKSRWAALQAAIRQLPKPLTPGLYRLPAPTE